MSSSLFWKQQTLRDIFTLKITLKIFVTLKEYWNHTEKYLQRKSQWQCRIILLKYFPLLFKDTESHWKNLNHTEKFSALLISFVPRFFSVTLDFECDFQCHNFIVRVRLGRTSFELLWEYFSQLCLSCSKHHTSTKACAYPLYEALTLCAFSIAKTKPPTSLPVLPLSCSPFFLFLAFVCLSHYPPHFYPECSQRVISGHITILSYRSELRYLHLTSPYGTFLLEGWFVCL